MKLGYVLVVECVKSPCSYLGNCSKVLHIQNNTTKDFLKLFSSHSGATEDWLETKKNSMFFRSLCSYFGKIAGWKCFPVKFQADVLRHNVLRRTTLLSCVHVRALPHPLTPMARAWLKICGLSSKCFHGFILAKCSFVSSTTRDTQSCLRYLLRNSPTAIPETPYCLVRYFLLAKVVWVKWRLNGPKSIPCVIRFADFSSASLPLTPLIKYTLGKLSPASVRAFANFLWPAVRAAVWAAAVQQQKGGDAENAGSRFRKLANQPYLKEARYFPLEVWSWVKWCKYCSWRRVKTLDLFCFTDSNTAVGFTKTE